MEVSPTPRQTAKGLLNGVAPPRPLFLPIVFSLGAKVENVSLDAFHLNPTKISGFLRQMRNHLRADGVACYFDPYLEVEALGATLERISDERAPTIHWPRAVRTGELPEGLRSPEEAVRSGRIPMAAEVLRRMNALPNREFLLMAGVAGPWTLAARITQMENSETLRMEDITAAALELAASVVTETASSFLEAGADMIFIQEEILPVLSAERCDAWANLLAPTINVVRFYEAIPVLLFPPAPISHQNWELICGQHWGCVSCLPAEVLTSRLREGLTATEEIPFGVALPREVFRSEGDGDKTTVQDLQELIPNLRPSIITTVGDVRVTTEMKQLIKVFEGVRGAV